MASYRAVRSAAAVLIASILLAACGHGSNTGGSAGSAGKEPIEMAIDNAGPDYLSAYVAQDKGLFAQQGLDVNTHVVTGTNALGALRAGSLQFAIFSASEVVNAAATDASVIDVADVENKWPYEFFVQPSITSAAQLKGKRVGVTTPGTATALGAEYAVQKLGIDPSDVGTVTTGSVQNLNAALLSGSVDAGVAHPPASFALQRKGLKVLYDLRSNPGTTGLSLVTSPDYLKSHRDIVQKMVNALTAAAEVAATDKDARIAAIKNHVTQVTDPSEIPPTADFYEEMVNNPPMPDAENLVAAQKYLASKDPKISELDLSKFVDPSFVKAASHSR